VPVVAARSDPSAEILGEGAGGILLGPDEWAELPAVVRQVGEGEPSWAERSAAARQRAEGWGWARSTDVLVELYRKVIDRERD
jgi:glycosyltransferase involved in cell wall biosynthesis